MMMNNIIVVMSFAMAGMMSLFSPLAMSHGSQGCCAECTLKREDEVEVVYEENQNESD
jgi:hypothetical protein